MRGIILVLAMSALLTGLGAAAEAPKGNPPPARIPQQGQQVPTLQSQWPDQAQQVQLPPQQQPAAPIVVPAPNVTVEAPRADAFSWALIAIAGAFAGLWAFKIVSDRFPPPQLVRVDAKALFEDPEFKQQLAVHIFQQRFSAATPEDYRNQPQGYPQDPEQRLMQRLIEGIERVRALPANKREHPDG